MTSNYCKVLKDGTLNILDSLQLNVSVQTLRRSVQSLVVYLRRGCRSKDIEGESWAS